MTEYERMRLLVEYLKLVDYNSALGKKIREALNGGLGL